MKVGFSWKVLVYVASSCSFFIREVYKTNRVSLKQLNDVFGKISFSRNGNFKQYLRYHNRSCLIKFY